jgi:hypothetical protein
MRYAMRMIAIMCGCALSASAQQPGDELGRLTVAAASLPETCRLNPNPAAFSRPIRLSDVIRRHLERLDFK